MTRVYSILCTEVEVTAYTKLFLDFFKLHRIALDRTLTTIIILPSARDKLYIWYDIFDDGAAKRLVFDAH